MTLEQIQKEIEEITAGILEARGVDLIETRVTGHANDVQIVIIADKPLGGITLDECAIINKVLRSAIDQENFLPPEVFSLELSSPGLDRPLVTRKDFMRCMDQELRFWLGEPVDGKKELQGRLKRVTENSLIVEVKDSQMVLPLSLIIKGKLVI
ncbi:MAG: hypothetical protein KGJ09_07745 [Candidatus Omnitrophica bacterium]|nr:hypothetical protein [Candidatus Omnitrophota bacterium]MDE2009954.1 hypothetical protein [Candidatus Omnitrophota bacterium]MDE2213932.1 hypothetical protein [Candidatus Omnitrophota bacterium]MDE2231918.1 hypothetical protein [Candidatus Omnitrophota bacterium]